MKGDKLAQPVIGSNVIKIIDSELRQSASLRKEHLSKTVRAVTAVVEQVSVKQAN